ncbi:hypothetical protein CEQ90_15825 [Lewinellaceae bacterium SD302]|nr:hypothetical protein CEQ90_15825 [Lewinellaceae bacterium SD302]
MNNYLLTFLLFIYYCANLSGQLYRGEKCTVSFRSDAPLELIEADSRRLRCAIDTEARVFAFRVKINSFEGFNGSLQREHFNENYLESSTYPEATFKGAIIERIDLSEAGEYTVRAKGTLIVHGIAQERIIKSTVRSDGERLEVRSNFTIPLEDHGIEVPRIVNQKIASDIEVSVVADLAVQ